MNYGTADENRGDGDGKGRYCHRGSSFHSRECTTAIATHSGSCLHCADRSSPPLVSVIMNVRNGGASLRQALDSVMAQTFKDWELIIWNDCSTDDSARIVAEFPQERIRHFVTSENASLGRARNQAIREAQGEWLAFLDQDDIWLPDKLSRQMALAGDDARVGLIYGRTVMFSRRGRERDFDHRHEFQPLPEGDIFERLFIDSCFISMSSAVVRRAAVQDIGEIPEFIRVIPDYYLFLATARRWKARAVQEVVCRYRLHSASMSADCGVRMQEEALLLVESWAHCLQPRLAARRRTVHSTVLAFEQMRRARTAGRGLVRLLSHGSLRFLLSRPFARLFRVIRRRVRRPYWVQSHRPLAAASETAYPKTLSVIVVNWNVCDLLRDCLRSLCEQMRLPRDAWELIVVDNASTDGSAEMLQQQFPDATLLFNRENVGFGKANNQALRICRGRYVLLLNPDTVVLDQAVDKMLTLMHERGDIAALGCRLIGGDGHFQRWTGGSLPTLGNIACHFLFLYKVLPAPILPPPLYLESDPTHDLEVEWVSGTCMLLRHEAIGEQVFDERFFMYGEDLDLCDRLTRAGWKVVYTPRAHIVHYDGRSLERQSPDVQFTKLRSLREVFAGRHRRSSVMLYDLVVVAGFVMRSVGFGLADLAKPGRGYEKRAAKSRLRLGEAVRALIRR
jgi:GT2 family glycosyltransferase